MSEENIWLDPLYLEDILTEEEKLIQKWIKLSIDKAKINSIKGKELTPFLIKEINKMSENKTLEANIELIINNAALAGKLAKKYYS